MPSSTKKATPKPSGRETRRVSWDRSANSRRKRKPDHTYKYVQQNENAGDAAKAKEAGADKAPAVKDKTGKDADETSEPPNKKPATDKDAEKASEEDSPSAKKDPYEFLLDADRKLMQTDILEFLKRFAPKFYVPVYKTWTIPKSAVH